MQGLGYFYVILASTLWAVMASGSKYLFSKGMLPADLVQARTSGTFVLMTLGILLIRPRLFKISRQDLPPVLISAALGMVANYFFYFYAISKINVGLAVLLEFTAPVFMTLFVLLFKKEKVSPRTLMALLMAFVGLTQVLEIQQGFASLSPLGIAAGFLAAITLAAYMLRATEHLKVIPTWTLQLYIFAGASLMWNLVHPPLHFASNNYGTEGYAWLAYIVVFGTIVPVWLFLRAIQMIGPIPVGITGNFQPIAAAMISFVALGESFSPAQMTGGILILAAIILLQLPERVVNRFLRKRTLQIKPAA